VRGLLATACLAASIAGCGGDDEPKSTAPPPDRPHAKKPLATAVRELERALPAGDCKVLIGVMEHSVQRGGVAPGTPPTKSDCAYVEREARGELRGFHATKVRELGTAGFSEGTGKFARRGFVVGIVWLLDSDGSWKAVFEAAFRPQIDLAPQSAARADANARRAIAAVKAGDCGGLWRVLNPASRFVRAGGGHRARYCATLPAAYRDRDSAFAQIKADPNPALDVLGRTRDFSFYAVRLENGRYMDLVLAGALGNVGRRAELREHDFPSVLEFVTVRRPR
jgi:hypothetical protein